MSSLGQLVATVALDTGLFSEGTSKAQYAAAKLATDVDRSFKDMERSAQGALGNIAGLFAAGFGVAALKSQFDTLVAYRGELEKMSVVTGASVQSLSILGQAAKLAGTDLGTIEGALVKMTKGLSASNADTKDTSRALEYLGISARDASGNLKDPGDVMLAVAKKLSTMEDGANKTAIALALFGKSGAQMLPTLKMLAEAGDLLNTVTFEQAKQAHDYEVALVRLHVAFDTAGRLIMSELVVPLTALYKAFTDNIAGADGLTAATKKLGEDGSLKSWGEQTVGILASSIDWIRTTAKTIEALVGTVYVAANTLGIVAAAAPLAIAGQTDKLKDMLSFRNEMWAQTSKIWKDLMDGDTNAMANAFKKQLDIIKNESPSHESLRAMEEHMKPGWQLDKPFKGTQSAPTAASPDAYDRLIKSMRDKIAVSELEINTNGKATDAEKEYAKFLQEVTNAIVKNNPEKMKLVAIVSDEAIKMAALKAQHDLDLVAIKDRAKFFDELIKKEDEHTTVLTKEVDKVNDEINTLGMSKDQLLLYQSAKVQVAAATELFQADQLDEAATMLESKGLLSDVSDGYRQLAESKRAAAGKEITLADMKARLEAGKDELGMWTQISDSAGKFFGDLVMNGKSAFDRLRTELKSFVQEIIALFAQKWILQMAAGLTGSAVLSNAAASAGGNTLAGAATNGLVGNGLWSSMTAEPAWYSAGIADGTITAAGSGTSTAITAETLQASTDAALGTGVTADAWMSTLGATGWGLLIVAAIAVIAAYMQKPGGPKPEGSFAGGWSPTGTRTTGSTGFENILGTGSTAMDSAVGQTMNGIASSYFAAITRYGGTPGALQLGLHIAADPSGTADTTITSRVGINGQQVFGSQDRTIGRDSANIQPEMQLEASRMLMAALQSSQLPAYLAHVFDGLTASTATQVQIDDAIKLADALNLLYNAVNKANPTADALQAFTDSLDPFNTSIRNNATAMHSAVDAYNVAMISSANQLTATQNLTAASVAYYNSQIQLIAGISQVKQSIDDMFGATFRNIRMAGMDNQGKYNFYQQEAQALQSQALASSDPAQIQALANRINADITAAFNLLTPAEQAAQGGAFLTRGTATQTAIDDRLLHLQQAAIDATQAMLKQIKDAIDAGAAAQKEAAASQVTAGNTQLEAARTPRTLDLNITGLGGNQLSVFGGG